MEYGILKRIKVKAKVNEETGKVSYRTNFKSRDNEGNEIWEALFINLVQDAANKVIDNDSYIYIKKGFLSFKKENGRTKWNIVIQDFDYDEETSFEEVQGFEDSYDPDELPF